MQSECCFQTKMNNGYRSWMIGINKEAFPWRQNKNDIL